MREALPDRRRNWTQKARIGGQVFYLCVGAYPDGRPGEIFITASRLGTFSRGVLDSLARSVSVSLQSGVSVGEVIKTLRGMSFPPDGDVEGSAAVAKASSVTDWVSLELEAAYLSGPPAAVVEKVAGVRDMERENL